MISPNYSALSDSEDDAPSPSHTPSIADLQRRLSTLQSLLSDVQYHAVQGSRAGSATAPPQTQDISDPEHLESRPKSANLLQKIERETRRLRNQVEREIKRLFEGDPLKKFLDRLGEIDSAQVKREAQCIKGQLSA